MSMNRTILQGRLVADPEMRMTQNGVAVANATLAVDRNYKDDSGEKQVDFFNLTAWRGTAEFLCKYFGKGEMVLVEGTLQNSNYTDKDGNKRVSTQVVVQSAFFCGSSRKSGERRESDPGATGKPDVSAEQFTDVDESDSDLPF